MSTQIIGDETTQEYDAARGFVESFEGLLRKGDQLTVVAGAQCFGERNVDVDLLVIAEIEPGLGIPDAWLPDAYKGRLVELSSFVATVEVKDHPPNRVRIEGGNQVLVDYRGKWSSGTEQARGQQVSVRGFLGRQGFDKNQLPYVSSFIWLRNWPRQKLPTVDHNIFCSDLTCADIVRQLVNDSASSLRWQEEHRYRRLSVGSNSGKVAAVAAVARMFRREIQATEIDRRKVEMICKRRVLKDQEYVKNLGSQLLVFRGRGGSGKTLRLLQIATELHDRSGGRVLFLTYNLSLVADVSRLFAIQGVSNRIGESAVKIESSTRFFFELLESIGMRVPQGNGGFPDEAYAERKRQLCEELREFSRDEVIEQAKGDRFGSVFSWDFVLVDEGQDWPADERDLLYRVFGPERLIVADGVDQLVRSGQRCNWIGHPLVGQKQVVSLRKCLRLKSNLCRFAEQVADRFGIDWDLDINDEVIGGRVVILTHEYTEEVHERVMRDHRGSGNQPVDALFCVTDVEGAHGTDLPNTMAEWGLEVWDGTKRGTREAFPHSPDQHRVVQYESVRGLEGWSVVCLGFDSFLEAKRASASHEPAEFLGQDPDQHGRDSAGRWGMIPLTRAMDTLVLQVDPGSRVGRLLVEIAEANGDFVEVW